MEFKKDQLLLIIKEKQQKAHTFLIFKNWDRKAFIIQSWLMDLFLLLLDLYYFFSKESNLKFNEKFLCVYILIIKFK